MQTNYIYGLHAVLAALRQQPEAIVQLFVLQSRRDHRMQEILALAHKRELHVASLSRQALTDLVGVTQHQGIVAELNPALTAQPVLSATQLAGFLQQLTKPALFLVLDDIQDPHNLGACLRSADAAGVDAVIFPKAHAVGITATVKKVACGAAESLTLFQVSNLVRTLTLLQQHGIWLYGAALEGQQSLYDCDLTQSVALLLGAEGKGLRRLTREHCDVLFHLPMQGYVQSLNVSVASGICLYEALRQRLQITRGSHQ